MQTEFITTTAAVMDDRDEEEPEFEVDSRLSSTNTDFGGADPAVDAPHLPEATFDVDGERV